MKLIILTLLIFAGSVCASGQTVTVPQEYLTSSVKAFQEVRTLRELVDAQRTENAAWQKALDAKTAEATAKDNLIQVQNERYKMQLDLTNSLTEQNKALAAIKCDESKVSFLFIVKISKKRCR
jgi:hypothetical protein